MRSKVSWLASVAVIVLAGCDAVQFPGGNERVERPAEREGPPPPPPLEPINPIELNGEIIDVPGSANIEAVLEVPAELGEPVLEPETIAIEPAPGIVLAEPAPDLETLLLGPDTLSDINARLCVTGVVEPETDEAEGVEPRICVATPIKSGWHMTSAQCLNGPAQFEVISSGRAETIAADPATAICHAGFTEFGSIADNDVALFRVAKIGPPAQDLTSDLAITSIAQDIPNGTFAVDMPFVEAGETESSDVQSDPSEVAGFGPSTLVATSTSGTCLQYAGSPLYATSETGDRLLAGILSSTEIIEGDDAGCVEATSRFMRLSAYVSWIETVMSACEVNPSLCEPEVALP